MFFDSKRAALAAWGLCAALALACRVSRQVHEPHEYPALKLGASALELRLTDVRPTNTDPNLQELRLPDGFEPRARARLEALLSGAGPQLRVVVSVAPLEALEIVDARGEMTRVVCRLELEMSANGEVLRRAETESHADLPRDEATPEEIAFVLDSTVTDAFDRYFADERTLRALDRDLAAQAAR
jgi:hypothetical protein